MVMSMDMYMMNCHHADAMYKDVYIALLHNGLSPHSTPTSAFISTYYSAGRYESTRVYQSLSGVFSHIRFPNSLHILRMDACMKPSKPSKIDLRAEMEIPLDGNFCAAWEC